MALQRIPGATGLDWGAAFASIEYPTGMPMVPMREIDRTTAILQRKSMSLARPVLPPELLAALRRVGVKLERQQSVEGDYHGIVQGFNTLPATLLTRAESEIVEAARLYYRNYRREHKASVLARLFTPRLADDEQLRRVPGLEFLFLFHRDGRIREAALRKIAEPVPSAFLFVALAWRLNDWVAQVRAAAVDCVARVFPITAPEVVAEAATVLLRRDSAWGRWDSERRLLDETLARHDVTEKLANILARRATGPSATILRHALRYTAMDMHLAHLARDAVQPAVRAVAAQTLIDGYTSWPNGWRWRWIDKSMGYRRAETVFEKRELGVPIDRLTQIKAGLHDRSAAVRNAAISGLIRYREEIPEVRSLSEPLLNDASRRVRERAVFLFGPQ